MGRDSRHIARERGRESAASGFVRIPRTRRCAARRPIAFPAGTATPLPLVLLCGGDGDASEKPSRKRVGLFLRAQAPSSSSSCHADASAIERATQECGCDPLFPAAISLRAAQYIIRRSGSGCCVQMPGIGYARSRVLGLPRSPAIAGWLTRGVFSASNYLRARLQLRQR